MLTSDIRQVVDPEGTLPIVELVPTSVQTWDGLMREKMAIITGGEAVGRCDIVTQSGQHSQKVHFDGIEVDENLRGRGIGLATYLLAIELAQQRNLPFETQDYDQTSDSKKIWESLARLGVAEVVEPFTPSTLRPDRFVGKYRVPAE